MLPKKDELNLHNFFSSVYFWRNCWFLYLLLLNLITVWVYKKLLGVLNTPSNGVCLRGRSKNNRLFCIWKKLCLWLSPTSRKQWHVPVHIVIQGCTYIYYCKWCINKGSEIAIQMIILFVHKRFLMSRKKHREENVFHKSLQNQKQNIRICM